MPHFCISEHYYGKRYNQDLYDFLLKEYLFNYKRYFHGRQIVLANLSSVHKEMKKQEVLEILNMIVDETDPPAEGQTSDNYLMTKYKRIRALCLAASSLLSIEDTEMQFSSRQQMKLKNHDVKRPLMQYLKEIEKEAILEALEETNYNKTKAAGLLGITFRQLRYKLEAHRIT
jgi:DNA-binding NtrC family response regulator